VITSSTPFHRSHGKLCLPLSSANKTLFPLSPAYAGGNRPPAAA
jgi:hypothetical protein